MEVGEETYDAAKWNGGPHACHWKKRCFPLKLPDRIAAYIAFLQRFKWSLIWRLEQICTNIQVDLHRTCSEYARIAG